MNDENVGKASLGFGGGCGGRQSECGAVVGGVMALGVKYGKAVEGQRTPEVEAARLKVYEESGKFLSAFTKAFGHTYCGKLTGYDFSQPGVYKQFKEDSAVSNRCLSYVEFAVSRVAAG